jgi:hypothetical protein
MRLVSHSPNYTNDLQLQLCRVMNSNGFDNRSSILGRIIVVFLF